MIKQELDVENEHIITQQPCYGDNAGGDYERGEEDE